MGKVKKNTFFSEAVLLLVAKQCALKSASVFCVSISLSPIVHYPISFSLITSEQNQGSMHDSLLLLVIDCLVHITPRERRD